MPGEAEPVGPRGPVPVVADEGFADIEDDGLNHRGHDTGRPCPACSARRSSACRSGSRRVAIELGDAQDLKGVSAGSYSAAMRNAPGQEGTRRYPWRGLLQRWSDEWLDPILHEQERAEPFPEAVRGARWLGAPGATGEEFGALEQRLDTGPATELSAFSADQQRLAQHHRRH